MTTAETMQMPALGEQGELCGGCGAPLAADQRYCLNCGQRRSGPRVDYRRYLTPEATETSPAPTASEAATSEAASPPEQQAPTGRDYTPLAAVGGIALLGLMLLVGVLIGKGNSSTAPAPPPQIVRLGSEAGSSESAPAAVPPKTGGGSPQAKQASKGTGAKAVEGGLTGQAAQQSDAPIQASKDDLQALNEQSGESYEETVKKLPDKIATPGAPPPVDNKAPGGGGGAQTIE